MKKGAANPERALYTKEYRAKNPDRVLKWKITAAIKILKENGYTVTKGAGGGEK